MRARRLFLWWVLGQVIGFVLLTAVEARWGSYGLSVFTKGAILILNVAGLGIVIGAAGQVSLASAGLFGVGAYTFGIVEPSTGPVLGAAIAIAAGFLVGVIVGLPAIRLSGLYLALATLAFVEAAYQVWWNATSLTGGSSGLIVSAGLPTNIEDRGRVLGQLGVLGVGTAIVLYRYVVGQTTTGLSWRVLRHRPAVGASSGMRVGRDRLLAFGVAGAYSGAAGVLFALQAGFLDPSVFDISKSVEHLVALIVGGTASVFGAVIGPAVLIYSLEAFKGLAEYREFWYGGLILLIVVSGRGSLAGLLGRLVSIVLRGDRRTQAIGADRTPESVDASIEPRATAIEPGRVLLEVQDVARHYGGVKAVDGVSLTILSGETVGIIGPNGAGKTSLLNILSGLDREAAGSCAIEGVRVDHLPAARRVQLGLSRTFQNVAAVEGLTTGEHLALGARGAAASMSYDGREEEWLSVVTDLFGLRPYLDVDTASLAYGLKKRADIGRALAAQPRLLLLDEPAAGLGSAEMDVLAEALVRVREVTGAGIVLIEHNMRFVRRMCDRLIVMVAGSVVVEGQPDVVLADERVIAAYLGSQRATTEDLAIGKGP